jgi:ribosomal protein L34E
MEEREDLNATAKGRCTKLHFSVCEGIARQRPSVRERQVHRQKRIEAKYGGNIILGYGTSRRRASIREWINGERRRGEKQEL